MKWWKDLRRSRDHERSGRKLPNNCQALQTNKRKVENCSFKAQENYKWKSQNRKENSEQADKSWRNSPQDCSPCPWYSPGNNNGVGCHSLPSPGDLPHPGIESGSPTSQADSSTIWATRKAPINESENRKENNEQADKSWKNSLRESADKGMLRETRETRGAPGSPIWNCDCLRKFWDWKGPFPHPRIKNVKSPTWCEVRNTMGEILNDSREKRIPKFCVGIEVGASSNPQRRVESSTLYATKMLVPHECGKRIHRHQGPHKVYLTHILP